MNCRICGQENASFCWEQGQALCPECLKDTPPKVSRKEFEDVYWQGEDPNDIPHSTRREFYSDYMSSTCTLDEYCKETSERF